MPQSDDELLDLAIEVCLEWGPQMARPVVDRIVERAPDARLMATLCDDQHPSRS